MKKLFEMFKQGLIRLAESESGEFLSTRDKARLLGKHYAKPAGRR